MGKQKDNRYRAKVTVGHHADGTAVYKYASGKTKKELAANVEELKKKYIGETIAVQREVLFKDYVREWYEAYKEPHLKAAGREMYRSVFHVHLMPAFGMRQMRSITGPDLQAWINKKNTSKSRVSQLYMIVRQIFRAAVAHGVIDRDPTLLLVKPAAPEGHKRALTDAETAAVLRVIETHKHALMLALLFYTGARIGEVLGFQWQDVDFAAKTITVQRDLDFKTRSLDTPKTEAAKRTIPLMPPLYAMLANSPDRGVGAMPILHTPGAQNHLAENTYKRWYESLMLAVYECDPTIESRPAKMAGMREARRKKRVENRGAIYVPAAEERASILTAHYFRHNYASILYNNDVDVLSAQRWLGHRDVKTTLQIYAHLGAQKEKQNTEKLEAAFEKLPKSCQDA